MSFTATAQGYRCDNCGAALWLYDYVGPESPLKALAESHDCRPHTVISKITPERTRAKAEFTAKSQRSLAPHPSARNHGKTGKPVGNPAWVKASHQKRVDLMRCEGTTLAGSGCTFRPMDEDTMSGCTEDAQVRLRPYIDKFCRMHAEKAVKG